MIYSYINLYNKASTIFIDDLLNFAPICSEFSMGLTDRSVLFFFLLSELTKEPTDQTNREYKSNILYWIKVLILDHCKYQSIQTLTTTTTIL